MKLNIRSFLKQTKVIPVAVLHNENEALKLTELLIGESINVIEVTFRTAAAEKCILAVKKRFPDMIVGAGSILSTEMLKKAADLEIDFAVSPILNESIIDFALNSKIPYIPGASTPSELHMALETSQVVKIFPAEQLGGVNYLSAISAPFRMFDFDLMPTGGVNIENISSYLETERVTCCGLTQIADSKLIQAGEFGKLKSLIQSFVKTVASAKMVSSESEES